MELWIRSQKRDNLIKVDWLKMEETPDGYGCKEYYICYRNERLLGSYKTKERALEVLDNIEKWITKTNENNQQVIIYEMPEE